MQTHRNKEHNSASRTAVVNPGPGVCPLPGAVRIYWLSTVVLTALALAVMLYRRFFEHLAYPHDRLVWNPRMRFTDLTIYNERFLKFGQAEFFSAPGHPFTYPAPVAVLYECFFRLFAKPLPVFLALVVAIALGWTVLLAIALRRHALSPGTSVALAATVAASAYPLWYLFDRANLEIFVWVVLGTAVLAFMRGRYWWAVALIGVATAMKLYPAVFFALFLSRRRFREIAAGLAVAVGVNLASLWAMGPTIREAFVGVQAGLAKFTQLYVYVWRPLETNFDHSLFSVVKISLAYHRQTILTSDVLKHAYWTYAVCLGVAGVLMARRFLRLPTLNQVFVVSIAAVLLPPVSYDYTLVHLYVPWALLVLALVGRWECLQRQSRQQVMRLMIYFAVVFTPQTYLLSGPIGYGGQVKALFLMALLVESFVVPLPEFPAGEGRMERSLVLSDSCT